jgi:hypothetical protein
MEPISLTGPSRARQYAYKSGNGNCDLIEGYEGKGGKITGT